MIALSASTIERALGALSARSVMVVRACRMDLTLPAGADEARDAATADTVIMTLDAASLADGAGRVAALPPDRTIAWAMPIDRGGVVAWALARARRLQPIALEDACDALRHAGVVDVRVTSVPGSLPIAVLTGRTTS